MRHAKNAGEGDWPEGTCYFNRDLAIEEEQSECAYPPAPISGLASTVFLFFKKSVAAVKHEGMSGWPGYRNREELESLARAHRVPWTERMLGLFRLVEEPWIEAERKRLKAESDAAAKERGRGK